VEKPITPRTLLALALCAAMAPSAGAMRFESESTRPMEATPQSGAPRGEGPRSEAPQGARMAVDARLLDNALKPGSVGLNEPGEWMARNTPLGQTATMGEANGVGRTVLNRLMEAPDRANVSFEKGGVVHLQVESASLGYAAQFSEGQFDGFTEKLIKSPPPIETTAVRHLITTDPKSLTAAEFNAIGELITKSVLDSPERVNVIVTKPDGTRELHIQAPDMGMTLRYSPTADFLGFTRTPMEARPGLWSRTANQIEKVGSNIKAFWDNLGEAGHVKMGKGAELTAERLAGKTWRQLEAEGFEKAPLFKKVDDAFLDVAHKNNTIILIEEPKAGSVVRLLEEGTTGKPMDIKTKTLPDGRVPYVESEHAKLVESGKYAIEEVNGRKFVKGVTSDIDLVAVKTPEEMPGIEFDPAVRGKTTPQEQAIRQYINDHLKANAGAQGEAVTHGAANRFGRMENAPKYPIRAYEPGNKLTIIETQPELMAFFKKHGMEPSKGWGWGENWKTRVETRGAPSIDLNNIFHGEIDAKGEAGGFHHRGSIGADLNARIIHGSELPPDKNGVYRAQVEILDQSNGQWVKRKSPTTFFPDAWSREKVILEIKSAYLNSQITRGGRWQGTSSSGLQIEGRMGKAGEILTAYPVYKYD